MSSPLPTLEEIKASTDLPVFEVSGDLNWMEGPVIVGDNDMDGLLEFAAAVKSEVVLVQYDYPDFDEYFIDPYDFPMDQVVDEEDMDLFLDAADKRNDEVEEFIQEEYNDEAVACSVYVNYQGTAYGVYISDDALIDSFGETAAEFVVRFATEYLDDEEEDLEALEIRAGLESGEGVEPP